MSSPSPYRMARYQIFADRVLRQEHIDERGNLGSHWAVSNGSAFGRGTFYPGYEAAYAAAVAELAGRGDGGTIERREREDEITERWRVHPDGRVAAEALPWYATDKPPVEPGKIPRVGVAAVIVRDGKLLLGLRHGSHGAGTWAFPGGHLDFGESFEECALRELWEETDMVATSARTFHVANEILPADDKHFACIFVMVENPPGDPRVKEVDKCREWGWFDPANLPGPLFGTIEDSLPVILAQPEIS